MYVHIMYAQPVQHSSRLSATNRKKVYHLAWLLYGKTILIRKFCKPSMPAYSVNTAIMWTEEKTKHKLSLYLTYFINSHCSLLKPACRQHMRKYYTHRFKGYMVRVIVRSVAKFILRGSVLFCIVFFLLPFWFYLSISSYISNQFHAIAIRLTYTQMREHRTQNLRRIIIIRETEKEWARGLRMFCRYDNSVATLFFVWTSHGFCFALKFKSMLL